MIKKSLYLLCFLLFFSCLNDNLPANCIRPLSLSITKSLNTSELNGVLTDRGFVYINGGSNGIFLLNKGLDKFVAFDRRCPVNNCNVPMSFEENLVLKCSCDNSEYSVDLGGTPQTEGFECPAVEYNVVKVGNSIRISNF
ncbi:Rieske (2Fe-2S) protein [Polaribacter sp. M15]